jgi:hypothetical protein
MATQVSDSITLNMKRVCLTEGRLYHGKWSHSEPFVQAGIRGAASLLGVLMPNKGVSSVSWTCDARFGSIPPSAKSSPSSPTLERLLSALCTTSTLSSSVDAPL